jgi:hypothetical protein
MEVNDDAKRIAARRATSRIMGGSENEVRRERRFAIRSAQTDCTASRWEKCGV